AISVICLKFYRWRLLRRGEHVSRTRQFSDSRSRWFYLSALIIHPCLNTLSAPAGLSEGACTSVKRLGGGCMGILRSSAGSTRVMPSIGIGIKSLGSRKNFDEPYECLDTKGSSPTD